MQKYAYHWLGDNWSTVEQMADSVKSVYEYQLYGLPFMGADLVVTMVMLPVTCVPDGIRLAHCFHLLATTIKMPRHPKSLSSSTSLCQQMFQTTGTSHTLM